jgi:hypothetical protein
MVVELLLLLLNEPVVFHETAGEIPMEAEHAQEVVGPWKAVEANGSKAMTIDKDAPAESCLKFTFRVETPAEYRVWVLAKSGGTADANDVRLRLDRATGRPDWQLHLGLEREFKWHNATIPRGAAYYTFERAGEHTLYVIKGPEPRGGEQYEIDKVILTLNRPPAKRGPGEVLRPAATRPVR